MLCGNHSFIISEKNDVLIAYACAWCVYVTVMRMCAKCSKFHANLFIFDENQQNFVCVLSFFRINI